MSSPVQVQMFPRPTILALSLVAVCCLAGMSISAYYGKPLLGLMVYGCALAVCASTPVIVFYAFRGKTVSN